ncbi:glycosyltransferase family 2 protein [Liquorilactobacillus oeni]|uniref:Glycosyltransferase n=1 Tax=Liquorilactobacillus oeni DSM 19972 TaxID=1423777 RepID=A0A0R1MPC7_9LACO|nr:glycosyltransferase [Liquorilactobacillus oeni]KRL05800.1 glycosyltransferase [Liquorilactobacillus oeni DSM 19972]
MENELVSLILPVFNIKEESLENCITSLENQTYNNIEIILVDDGSTNNAYELCQHYADKDARVKVISQKNAGVSVARNNGLKKSHGSYIGFIDPDDWVAETYVADLLRALQTSNADFVISDCIVSYNHHDKNNRFLDIAESDLTGDKKNLLLYQLVGKKICEYYPPEIAAGVPWAKLFKKSFIEKNKLTFIPGMRRMQDNIFCLYAIECAAKIHYLPKKLYYYRKEEGSASFKYSAKIVENFERYFDETFKFLDTFHKEAIMYSALYMKELTSFNSFLGQYYFHPSNSSSYSDIRKQLNVLLNTKRYQEALSKIDYHLLNNQEKVFVFCLKHKLYFALKILVYIRNKSKN